MLTLLELSARILIEEGLMVHPATIHGWIVNGRSGVKLPSRHVGLKCKIRVRWRDYLAFKKKYQKAKKKAKVKTGRKSVVLVA